MTGSILTPFTLVAIVIILGCVLAALYFLARRRTPSAKPAPRDGRPPLPRVAPPPPAARPALNDGPGRTVLMGPGSRQPARARRACALPRRAARHGGDRASPARRQHAAEGRAAETRRRRRQRVDAGAGDNRGIGATPAAAKLPVTVLLPNDDDGRVGKPLPPPAAARPQQPVTKPVEDDEVTTPRRIDPAVDDGKDRHPGRTGPAARQCRRLRLPPSPAPPRRHRPSSARRRRRKSASLCRDLMPAA